MNNPLDRFQRKHDYLVGIDSDGCAFDSMEIKHKECFIPRFIKYFGLQPISKYAREAAEFSNLYSKGRGANRFPAYLLALELLEQRREVEARQFQVPRLPTLREWVKRQQDNNQPLGNPTLETEVAQNAAEDLALSLKWSIEVNDAIADMLHGVPPFPHVRESLKKLSSQADMIVCSATPNAALENEWQEHDIAAFVVAICGQEAGSKSDTLGQAASQGYAPNHVLMIGDAPGDLKAARTVGSLFYPINPGCEESSWKRFHDEACDRFLNENYAGDYEQKLIDEFDTLLPKQPPWQQ